MFSISCGPVLPNFAWFQKNPNLGFRDITFEQHQFVRCMITYCHQKRCDYNILKNHVHSFFSFWVVVGYMASQSLCKTLYFVYYCIFCVYCILLILFYYFRFPTLPTVRTHGQEKRWQSQIMQESFLWA